MNGFLVQLVHVMDDLPIALLATAEEANLIAGQTKSHAAGIIRKLFNVDPDSPIGVFVVEFQNGKPIKRWEVKSFD